MLILKDLYGEMLLLKREMTRATLQTRWKGISSSDKQTLFFNAPAVDLDNLIQENL